MDWKAMCVYEAKILVVETGGGVAEKKEECSRNHPD